MEKQPPIHPGEILQEGFLAPMNIGRERLAEDTGIPLDEVASIIDGRASITPNAALRLSLFFGLSERFWVNLQSRFDLETEKDKSADRLKSEVRVLQPV
jgi:addiction module HigA family antidote